VVQNVALAKKEIEALKSGTADEVSEAPAVKTNGEQAAAAGTAATNGAKHEEPNEAAEEITEQTEKLTVADDAGVEEENSVVENTIEASST